VNISIIIPIYNTSNYLLRCINSIIQQNFNGTFEVIAIDAASTDSSIDILNSFKGKIKNFTIIENEKRISLSTSRADGMKIAKGDFILHVDSDDWLMPDALQIVYTKAIQNDADVVIFNYIKDDGLNYKQKVNLIKINKINYNKFDVHHLFFSTCWNKLVKNDLVSDMIYSKFPITIEEDFIYSMEIFLRSKKIYLCNSHLYSYYINSNSLTKTINPSSFLESRLVQIEAIRMLIMKYNPTKTIIIKILNYFEKGIHIESSRIHFYEKKNIPNFKELHFALLNSKILNSIRIKRIHKSLNNKYWNLFALFLFCGPKYMLGTLKRSLFI
jgi:glycosyltransferase involved in cell wall biosynthesis